jgi:hypothetical protein
LVAGHAYTIIQVKEAFGNKLLNIRNPWGEFEWDGDWSDKSDRWTDRMKQALDPVLEDNDGTFWMSYEDVIKHFINISICRISDYYEVRSKGKFMFHKVHGVDRVVSRWFYELTVHNRVSVFIGLH